MTAFEKNLFGVRGSQVPALLPGLLLAAALAWLSLTLCQYLGVTVMGFEKSPISAVMMAILLGLVMGNVFALPAWLKARPRP